MPEMDFDSTFLPGTRVEVRNHYTRSWARGFAVIGVDSEGYRLQRLSDGARLPVAFDVEEIRPVTRSPLEAMAPLSA